MTTHKEVPSSVVIVEPFGVSGSHQQLVSLVEEALVEIGVPCSTYQLTARKWKWRLRCSAMYFAETIPPLENVEGSVFFCSSMLNLPEFLALRPDFGSSRKIVYFHENQLEHPVRPYSSHQELEDDWDFQLGWIQIQSCLVADEVIFNSMYNLNSFMDAIHKFLHRRIPAEQLVPSTSKLRDRIIAKSRVLFFPIRLASLPLCRPARDPTKPLRILWSMRWEWDKNPEAFFAACFDLKSNNVPFELSVVGEQFAEYPAVFDEAKERLASEIKHWGFRSNKREYYDVLREADVIVSTSFHEFYGVSVLEAALHGVIPLCPKRLSYVELLPESCLYKTDAALAKWLRYYARHTEKIASFPREELEQRLRRVVWEGDLRKEWLDLFR